MVDRSRELATRTAVLVFLAFGAAPAWSAPRSVAAKVVWAKEARAYVAPLDTTSLELGSLVTLVDRKRTVASGDVIAVQAGELVVVRLTAGSLRKVKHLDRLTILAERPATTAPPLLRLGAPSRRRSSLMLRCVSLSMAKPCEGCTTEMLAEDRIRVLAPAAAHEPWPDTLFVRLFDDATDEEIALERGEIDAGVFWPGELSAHLRDDTRWQTAFGTRARGYVGGQARDTAVPVDSVVSAVANELESMNSQLFRGDLAAVFGDATPPDSIKTGSPARSIRILVDASIPGQRAMQRFFDRGSADPGRAQPRPTLGLSYVDAAVPDPPSSGSPAPAGSAASGARPLFAIRCPIVFGAGVGAVVRALGPDALVNMIDCGSGNGSR